MDIYNTEPQLKNSLIVGFLKAAAAKISGMGNPRYVMNVVNFYSMMETTTRKGCEDVLADLMGPCLRQIYKFNEKFTNEDFIVEDDDVLEERLHEIFEKSTSGIDNVSFSVSINATRVMKDQHLSTSYKSVIVGAHHY